MLEKTNNPLLSILQNEKCRLVQLSFLMLFIELVLIRWTGSNIVYLSFFSNFILLASFLGMGIGFIRAKSTTKNIFPLSPIFFALLILFCYQYRYQYHVKIDPITDDLNYYGIFFKDNFFPYWLTLPIIFLASTAVMASIADGTARTFKKFSPLQAYRLEILGSLLGVIVFSLLSFFNASPLSWGIIITLLFISLLIKEWKWFHLLTIFQIAALILIMTALGNKEITANHVWSPYYKIGVESYSKGRYVINVNGLPQQFVESVEQRKKYKPFYFFPYQHIVRPSSLDNVLVIGAGTGGDVAIALAQGAKQVDAVEIDPLLYRLGKKLNPNQPYSNPRVRVFIDDGRAFLQKNSTLYDMIIFALPDSLMLISGQSSLRLENYLFTLEGISMVKNHLKSDGIFTMYNYYRERWIVDRLANTLTTVFKHTPCLDTYGDRHHWLSALTISSKPSALSCNALWQPTRDQYVTPTTDNYPFLYLEENHISYFYVISLLFIFLASLSMIKITGVSYYSIKNYLDLFFMGAAFLLLETKSIANFALLFGTTWFVNSLVFIGILSTIYFAIEVTYRIKPLRCSFLYGWLLISLFCAWIIPSHDLLSLSPILRFFTATTLAFAPIFIANLIFANRFRSVMHSTDALGANLIGAVLGGLLEYGTLIVGYQNLIILIALLYTIAIGLMMTTSSRSHPLTSH